MCPLVYFSERADACLSVCLSFVCVSETFVHPIQAIESFYAIWYVGTWESADMQVKFCLDHPRGTSPSES